jgi:two-component system response regulator QseB
MWPSSRFAQPPDHMARRNVRVAYGSWARWRSVGATGPPRLTGDTFRKRSASPQTMEVRNIYCLIAAQLWAQPSGSSKVSACGEDDVRILLVEDDPLIGDATLSRLRKAHHSVEWARNGLDAEAALIAGEFDVAILDLGLPGKDGLEVLREIRALGRTTPVIALTARDGVAARVAGLDDGADDYLVKPFDMDELIARCRALARRSNRRVESTISAGDITLNTANNQVEYNQLPVTVSPNEFRVLQCLLESKGKVVSKERLAEVVYGWNGEAESNTIEVYVSQLRKKLSQDAIRTLRGVGYIVS